HAHRVAAGDHAGQLRRQAHDANSSGVAVERVSIRMGVSGDSGRLILSMMWRSVVAAPVSGSRASTTVMTSPGSSAGCGTQVMDRVRAAPLVLASIVLAAAPAWAMVSSSGEA